MKKKLLQILLFPYSLFIFIVGGLMCLIDFEDDDCKPDEYIDH